MRYIFALLGCIYTAAGSLAVWPIYTATNGYPGLGQLILLGVLFLGGIMFHATALHWGRR